MNLLYNDYDNTGIISSTYVVIYDEDLCKCDKEYYYDNTNCWCNASTHPRVKCTKILVRVAGKPIRFNPDNCQYILSIWMHNTTKNQITEDMFDDADPNYEFTLVNTNDPADLDKNEYMNIIKQIYPNPLNTGFIEYNDHLESMFKGVNPIKSYESAFYNLLKKIITSTPRSQPTECDHVKPKKKKSHRRR
jgi:hypothetical protein